MPIVLWAYIILCQLCGLPDFYKQRIHYFGELCFNNLNLVAIASGPRLVITTVMMARTLNH